MGAIKTFFVEWWELIAEPLREPDLGMRLFGLVMLGANIAMAGLCVLLAGALSSTIVSAAVDVAVNPPVDYCYITHKTVEPISAWVIYGHRTLTADRVLWVGDFNNAANAWGGLGCVGPLVGSGVGAAP